LAGYWTVRAEGRKRAGETVVVKDWIADWKRWSRAERCFAIALLILSLVVPIGLLLGGT
jgi:hypothetical protein